MLSCELALPYAPNLKKTEQNMFASYSDPADSTDPERTPKEHTATRLYPDTKRSF